MAQYGQGDAMAEWHLKNLENGLMRRGWRIVAVHDGDGYRISASWSIQRSTRHAPLYIDFDGLDETGCLPVEQSYGCSIRDRKDSSLYFGKPGKRWRLELSAFLDRCDDAELERS